MTNIYPEAIVRTLTGHSAPGNLAEKNLIVLHITQGSSAASAIATFVASVHPNRVSAHFVIDRDGTVFQLLDPSDIGWHASEVNARSIGIEHAAITGTLMATDAQYQASAKLVVWLCALLKIPIDRQHILGHNEASPIDGHVQCCEGALSADRLVQLAQSL